MLESKETMSYATKVAGQRPCVSVSVEFQVKKDDPEA